MKKLLIFSCFIVAASTQALIIDDFSSGTFAMSITSGSWVGSQGGSMLGGERDAGMTVVANPLNQFLDLQVGSGMYISSGGVLLESQIGLDYDGVGDETDNVMPFSPGLPGLGSLNLAASNDRFRITFRANDLPLTMTIETFTYTVGMKSSTVNVAGGQVNPFSVDVLFSSFTGAGTFADVDRIRLFFNTSPGGDFAIDKIEAVPEPASLIAIGSGLVGLVVRRRRRK